MGLKVWLPLNGDLTQQGTSNISMINSNATVNTSGKIGSCYYFNASSYLYENTYNWTNFNTSQFSLCCWYKQPSPVASGNSQIICIGTSSGWNNIRIGLLRRTSNGYPMFSVSDGSSAVQYSCTATTFSLDTWNHIACTYDNGTIKIYLNGTLDKTYTTTIVPVLNSSQHLGVGAASNGAEKLTGYLNDVRIYDHCLSAAEVREISQGLVLHYKLDGIRQNYILNSSGVFLTNLGSADGSRAEYRAKTLGQNLPIASGTTITISFDLHMEFKTANPYLYVYNTNNKGPHQTINGINALAGRTVQVGDIIDERISVTGTITDRDSPTQTTDFIEFYSNYGSNNWFSISNIKLEIGNNATPYIPAEMNLPNIIEDSSGYNHNGTIVGNLTFINDTPRYSTAAVFNGSTKIYNTTAPIRNTNGTPLTVSCWFYQSSRSGYRDLVTARSSSAYTWMLYTHTTDGSIQLHGSAQNKSTVIPDLNTWHHVAAVVNDNSTYNLYLDGEKVVSAASYSYQSQNADTINIGAYGSNTTIKEGWIGYISDVRIYCTSLDDDAIRQLYEVGAKVDDKQNLHTFEIKETNNNLLAGRVFTSSYGSKNPITNPFTNFNSNGEYQFTTNSTSMGSEYIPINPTGHTYLYDVVFSANAGNQFDIGFERFDADKTARANSACTYIYASNSSTDLVKKHIQGTVNLSTDGVNPCAFISLRVLNGWSGTTSGVTGTATIHNISLREVSTLQTTKLIKTGQFIEEEIKEEDNMKIQKNGIIETSQIIEV